MVLLQETHFFSGSNCRIISKDFSSILNNILPLILDIDTYYISIVFLYYGVLLRLRLARYIHFYTYFFGLGREFFKIGQQ